MAPPKILLQFDSDRHASTFDAIVAKDAGVETLLQYPQLTPEQVPPLVHGAMFTRGGDALRHTAIFVGGSDVSAAEALLERVRDTFFGPVRVSVMFDANGCNTTAAAAVLSAMRHVEVASATATVLAGTGPVGMRVARLLLGAGCRVRLASRNRERAAAAVEKLVRQSATENAPPGNAVSPVETPNAASTAAALDGADVVFACGAAGVQLLDRATLATASACRVAVDLNAVPPAGIEGIQGTDRAAEVDGRFVYGALGVGGLKMKIHRAALRQLFNANDQVLDAEQIFEIGRQIAAGTENS